MSVSIQSLHRLAKAMKRPGAVDGLPEVAVGLVNECWVALIANHVPIRRVCDLLVDDDGTAHGSIFVDEHQADQGLTDALELHNDLHVDLLDEEAEVAPFLVDLEGSRSDYLALAAAATRKTLLPGKVTFFGGSPVYDPGEVKPLCGVWLDEEFDRRSGWIRRLRVVKREDRKRHWPPPSVVTMVDLVAHSASQRKESWLAPDTDVEALRQTALAALATYFYRSLDLRADAMDVTERADEFLATWDELFGQRGFRLGVAHTHIVGADEGVTCNLMVYDYDPDHSEFHCYPVRRFESIDGNFAESDLAN